MMLSRVVLRSAVQQGASLVNLYQWRTLKQPVLAISSPHFYSTASNKVDSVSNNRKAKQNKKVSSGGNTKNKTPEQSKKSSGDGQKKEQNKKAPNSGKELRPIQSMPSRLTKLVTDSKDVGWPSLTNIAILTSKCHQAGVDMDQVEDFFIRQFRKASKSDDKSGADNNREYNFFSKHLLEKYQIDNSVLKSYLTSYLEPNIYRKADKLKLPIKRAEYCIAMMRLAYILGDMPTRTEDNIQIVQTFIEEKNIEDETIKKILKLAEAKCNDYQVTEEEREFLINFVCDQRIVVAGESEGGGANMPSLLTQADCLKIINTLCSSPVSPVSPVSVYDRTRLLSRSSQVCWDQGNFSLALETLHTNTESYIAALLTEDQKHQERLLSVVLDIVEVWHSVASTAAKENMKPAMEYLMVVAELVSSKWPQSGLGLLPSYILLLSVNTVNTEAANLVREKLEARIVPRVRGAKFERCFLVAGMTRETKQFFITDYLQRLLLDSSDSYSQPTESPAQLESQKTPEINTETEPHEEAIPPIKIDGALAVDMLDISVLELASEKKNAEMIDAIIVEHSRSGLLPSCQALETVIKTLQDSGDLYSLTSLRRLVPQQRSERERIYEAIASLKLRELNSRWEEDKVRAWVGLVQLYRKIWSDQTEGEIQVETRQSALRKCCSYAKLFVEEATATQSPANDLLMKPMQLGCSKVATDFADLSLLLIYWEALFFSVEMEHHQLSDLILDNVPVLLDQINIDSVLQRCER